YASFSSTVAWLLLPLTVNAGSTSTSKNWTNTQLVAAVDGASSRTWTLNASSGYPSLRKNSILPSWPTVPGRSSGGSLRSQPKAGYAPTPGGNPVATRCSSSPSTTEIG